MSSVTTWTRLWPPADQPSSGPGRQHPHPGGALGPDAGQVEVGGEGAVEVVGRALADVLGGDVAVVGADQRTGVRRAAVGAGRGLLRGLAEECGLLVVEPRRHTPDTRTPGGAGQHGVRAHPRWSPHGRSDMMSP